MALSPKERFQQFDSEVAVHQKLVASATFETAMGYAMNEYAEQLSRFKASDANAAAGVGFKLAGAVEFLTVLKELAEKPAKPQAPVRDNLDHNQ